MALYIEKYLMLGPITTISYGKELLLENLE
mgnify:CR=1 FL=1